MPVERSGLGSTILSVAGCQRDHVPRNQYALEMQIMAVIPTETRGETHEKLILDRPEIIASVDIIGQTVRTGEDRMVDGYTEGSRLMQMSNLLWCMA